MPPSPYLSLPLAPCLYVSLSYLTNQVVPLWPSSQGHESELAP